MEVLLNWIISYHLPFDLARHDRAPTEGREPGTICLFPWREWPMSTISGPAAEETAISCDYNGLSTSGKMSRSGSRQEGRHVQLYRPQLHCEWDGPQTGNPWSRARDCSFLVGPAECNCGYLVRYTCKRLASFEWREWGKLTPTLIDSTPPRGLLDSSFDLIVYWTNGFEQTTIMTNNDSNNLFEQFVRN